MTIDVTSEENMKFPTEGLPQATLNSKRAILWSRFRYWLKNLPRRLVHRLKLPGTIQDFQVDDAVLGYTISVRTTGYATYLAIGPRDYSFDRLTGKMIGSGCSMGCAPR